MHPAFMTHYDETQPMSPALEGLQALMYESENNDGMILLKNKNNDGIIILKNANDDYMIILNSFTQDLYLLCNGTSSLFQSLKQLSNCSVSLSAEYDIACERGI